MQRNLKGRRPIYAYMHISKSQPVGKWDPQAKANTEDAQKGTRKK